MSKQIRVLVEHRWDDALHRDLSSLAGNDHTGYGTKHSIAFPWPEDCPISPEKYVRLNRCGNERLEVIGAPRPYYTNGGGWNVPVILLAIMGVGYRKISELSYVPELKRCEHKYRVFHGEYAGDGTFIKCSSCGTILSDRRKGERRKGERRKIGNPYGCGGRRICVGRRCTGKDRRES